MLIRIVPGPAAARCCDRMRAARLTGWALGELTWEERLKEELQREGMFPQRDALGPCGVRLWGLPLAWLEAVEEAGGLDLWLETSPEIGANQRRGRGSTFFFGGCPGNFHTLDSLKQ